MGLLGTEYRPEHYFGKLRFFNCYNPLVMREILDHKLNFIPHKTDTDPFVLDTTDQANRRHVANLNGFYFRKLNALGELISEGEEPIEILESLKALHDLLQDEWYSDFLTGEGIFEHCILHVSLEKAESLMVWPEKVKLDQEEGYPAPDLSKYTPITDKYKRLKDLLLNETFTGIVGIDALTMPGLGFSNPWREAIQNMFTDKTVEHAKECFLNDQFKSALKIVREASGVPSVPAIKKHSFGAKWEKARMKDMGSVISAESVKGLYAKVFKNEWERAYKLHQLFRNEARIGKRCLYQDTDTRNVFVLASDIKILCIIEKKGRKPITVK
jgi:hypothetical protein